MDKAKGGILKFTTTAGDFEAGFITSGFDQLQYANKVFLYSKQFNNSQRKKIAKYLVQMTGLVDNYFDPTALHAKKIDYFVILPGSSDSAGGEFTSSKISNTFFLFGMAENEAFNYVMLHEYIHKYIGGVLKAEVEVNQDWFIEGFTDYFALYLGSKYNLLEKSEIIEYLNYHLSNYYNMLGDSITLTNLLQGNDVFGEIIYPLGFYIAYNLDVMLKNLNFDYSLYGEIKDRILYTPKEYNIYKAIKQFDIDLNANKTLQKYTNNILHSIRRLEDYIPNEIFDIAFKCSAEAEIPEYDLNIFKSVQEMKVLGVNPGSKAANLGLKNGQKICDVNISEEGISITVQMGVEEKEVFLKPVMIQKSIPQYCEL